ncbi:hypothetical protein COEREDRAFT_82598 [Coemansia reversa NRRL 1564]|uniref:DASH complex subunit DUO1 n=1 Tax=Coemansia reversa (strain ATCC 12441 / NRRL 1564) TaxID=763665 RepID=A0A2G5B6V0_COERN|nr:hypothetical protein COEREDRAFT_82598 [Coemansia reversa NRRL 1564]|eukprot:PIA14721.1 hypothetical protein COEREDRAFT_82598 [Coemansia reversa NRRL 1564]
MNSDAKSPRRWVQDALLVKDKPEDISNKSDGEECNSEHPAATDFELEELRLVRRVLSKINQGIENVQHQMKYFNSNVSQTTQLLDIWVRILSQTAHNQSFLLNGEWRGSSMDATQLNNLLQRDMQRQEEAERQAQAQEAELKREQERVEARERERQSAELATEYATKQVPSQWLGPALGRRPLTGQARGKRGATSGSRRGAATSTRGYRGRARSRGRSTIVPSPGSSRIQPPPPR